MPSSPNRRRLIAVVVVLVAVVGWQQLQRSRPHGAANRDTGTARPIASWQVGSLRLASCTVGKASTQAGAAAWCTRVEVPENRTQPGGRRIGLKVAVIRSTTEQPLPDWLVFLDGGPGGAATDDYPPLRAAFADMARRRQLLLVDQRGTGGSNALSCEDPAQAEHADTDTAVVDKHNRIVAEYLARRLELCLRKLRASADPAMYTTGAAVEDLEAVRQALGGPQFNLIGVSYGTRVAQQYARTYPGAVRSIVLDSAVPNSLYLGNDHARNLEDSLRLQFARCTADPICKQRFGDPYAAMHQLRRQLQAQPLKAAARDPLTHAAFTRNYGAGDLAATARLFAYSPMTTALLPLSIDAALKGDITPLLSQEKLIIDAVTERLTDGVGLSVACAEDADGLRLDPADDDTLLGNSLVDYVIRACQTWPKGSSRADFHAPFRSSAPTLVLSGEFDPVTPIRYGTEITGALGAQARLLTLKGQGHGVMDAGCMPRLLGKFIDELQPAKLDSSCLDRLGYVPVFLSHSGAAP